MLEEILRKETLDEQDLEVVHRNMHLLSDLDLIRLGFKEPVDVEIVEEEEKPKKVSKKSL